MMEKECYEDNNSCGQGLRTFDTARKTGVPVMESPELTVDLKRVVKTSWNGVDAPSVKRFKATAAVEGYHEPSNTTGEVLSSSVAVENRDQGQLGLSGNKVLPIRNLMQIPHILANTSKGLGAEGSFLDRNRMDYVSSSALPDPSSQFKSNPPMSNTAMNIPIPLTFNFNQITAAVEVETSTLGGSQETLTASTEPLPDLVGLELDSPALRERDRIKDSLKNRILNRPLRKKTRKKRH